MTMSELYFKKVDRNWDSRGQKDLAYSKIKRLAIAYFAVFMILACDSMTLFDDCHLLMFFDLNEMDVICQVI